MRKVKRSKPRSHRWHRGDRITGGELSGVVTHVHEETKPRRLLLTVHWRDGGDSIVEPKALARCMVVHVAREAPARKPVATKPRKPAKPRPVKVAGKVHVELEKASKARKPSKARKAAKPARRKR